MSDSYTPLKYTQSKADRTAHLVVRTPASSYTIEALKDLISEAIEAASFRVTSVSQECPQDPSFIKEGGITLGRDQTRVPEARINQSSSVQQARKRDGKER
jgi:hypothetical protein